MDSNRLYLLEVMLDFERNRWSAWLNGEPLANDLALAANGQRLDLEGIDATWILGTAGFPGNNFMLFDEYRVVAESSGEPSVLLNPANVSVRRGAQATLRVVAGGDQPLQYQWRREGVDLPGANNAVLRLDHVDASQAEDSKTRGQISTFDNWASTRTDQSRQFAVLCQALRQTTCRPAAEGGSIVKCRDLTLNPARGMWRGGPGRRRSVSEACATARTNGA